MALSPSAPSAFEPPFLEVEQLERYRVGGYHPLHLGDLLNGDRYRIIHKLGFGGSATIWLARDSHLNRNVAIKILIAGASNNTSEVTILQHLNNSSPQSPIRQHVAVLLDHFHLEGPNGSHLCLVMPVVGPSVVQYAKAQPRGRLNDKLAPSVAQQAAQGLASLHAIGIGHGGMNTKFSSVRSVCIHSLYLDFTTSNLLLKAPDFATWNEADIYDRLGHPAQDPVSRTSGGPPEPHAPSYVVEPANMSLLHVTGDILIVDFGQSFFLENPPKDPGYTLAYCAPELLFGDAASFPADVWSLACSLFEIRAGCQIFEDFLSDREDMLRQMVSTLGKLPEPWWQAWEERAHYFEEDGAPKKQSTGGRLPANLYPLREQIEDIGSEDTVGDLGAETDAADGQQKGLELLEIDALEDLLGSMLRYHPGDRVTVAEALEMPWFARGVS
ncbi:hypothetical protein MMC08_008956 [Hypocenomyce scalaris]|nr:hypothetical protein [Hypocenomyce scalaris]